MHGAQSGASLFVRPGIYDAMVLFEYDGTVVREGIDVLQDAVVEVAAGEAVHELRHIWDVEPRHFSTATVQRGTDGETWADLGAAELRQDSRLHVEDASVAPATRYAYRLRLSRNALDHFTPVTWVDVPANVLSFAGPRENPSVGPPVVQFTLPDGRPATIDVHDLSGRRVISREVGSLGPGLHRVTLAPGSPWRAGIYFLKLRHPDGAIVCRVCVLR